MSPQCWPITKPPITTKRSGINPRDLIANMIKGLCREAVAIQTTVIQDHVHLCSWREKNILLPIETIATGCHVKVLSFWKKGNVYAAVYTPQEWKKRQGIPNEVFMVKEKGQVPRLKGQHIFRNENNISAKRNGPTKKTALQIKREQGKAAANFWLGCSANTPETFERAVNADGTVRLCNIRGVDRGFPISISCVGQMATISFFIDMGFRFVQFLAGNLEVTFCLFDDATYSEDERKNVA